MREARGQLMLRLLKTAASTATIAKAQTVAPPPAPVMKPGMTIKEINALSYPNIKTQLRSIGDAVKYRLTAPFKGWNFRQNLEKLRTSTTPVSMELDPLVGGSLYMAATPEAKGLPASLLAPQYSQSFPNKLGETVYERFQRMYNARKADFLRALGHESVHMSDDTPSKADPGPAGIEIVDSMDKYPLPFRTMIREVEPSMQSIKTTLYHLGVDPYSSAAEPHVRRMLSSGKLPYFQVLKGNEKAVDRLMPLLMHIMRGVAANSSLDLASRTV